MRFLLILLVLFPMLGFAEESLVVYSGRSDKFVKPVVEKFTEKTGVKVTIHAASSTALLNKLKLEADRTDADLFISNDAGNLQAGSDMNLFQTLPQNVTSLIPELYRASNNTWLGLSARARVLVVNKNAKNASAIKSVFDLAGSQFKNRIAITHSANESFIAGATVYMLSTDEKKTSDWLTHLKENAGKNVFNKHSKIVSAVADGKVDVGLVNHYYIYRHLAKTPDSPVSILLPDQGSDQMGVAWNVAGIAMSKHAKHRENALKFIEFLVSEEGQKIFAEVNKEYPTRPGVVTAKEIPPLDKMKVAQVPMENLGKYRNQTIDLIEKAGLQ